MSICSVPGASHNNTALQVISYFYQSNWNSKSLGNIPRITQLGSCRAKIWSLIWLCRPSSYSFWTVKLYPPQSSSIQMGNSDPAIFQGSSLKPLSHWGRLVISKEIHYLKGFPLHPSLLWRPCHTCSSLWASVQSGLRPQAQRLYLAIKPPKISEIVGGRVRK